MANENWREGFDRLVARAPEPFQTALINVCDTADFCRLWFQGVGVQASAADIVALTGHVMREAERLQAEADRPHDDRGHEIVASD